VANNASEDNGREIINGNERVLNARLADALFFFETDLQTPLESHLEKLKKVVFNEKLGTVFDRIFRIISLCEYIHDGIASDKQLSSKTREQLLRAVYLAKCDLSTNMVCEFTELQGIMGAHYACAQGESEEVCAIIRDQYKPVEELSSLLSAIFSLADKIDVITSLFAIGKEPTGSKDPFALRRAAIGVLKIIQKYELVIDIRSLVGRSIRSLEKQLPELSTDAGEKISEKVVSFILDRLKIFLKERGIQHNVVTAVITSSRGEILSICQKAEILNEAVKSLVGEKLVTIYKRARNITENCSCENIDETLLMEPSEKRLFDEIGTLQANLEELERSKLSHIEMFQRKLGVYIKMEEVRSDFFDCVLVNAEDKKIQQNRISILMKLVYVFDKFLPEISHL
jgi:glycyl-tRNA synthetase beta chain